MVIIDQNLSNMFDAQLKINSLIQKKQLLERKIKNINKDLGKCRENLSIINKSYLATLKEIDTLYLKLNNPFIIKKEEINNVIETIKLYCNELKSLSSQYKYYNKSFDTTNEILNSYKKILDDINESISMYQEQINISNDKIKENNRKILKKIKNQA